jgi:mycothiol synthase
MGDRPAVEVSAVGDTPTDDEVAEIVELAHVVAAESRPDDPPISAAEVGGRLRLPLPEHLIRTWLARVDGRLVGRLSALMDLRSSNTGFVEIGDVEVHPDHRRRGIGTALARIAVAELSEAGARSLMIWPWDDAGRGFVERFGLSLRQEERQSRLRVAEVDDAQQDEWIAAPSARAAGYRVVSWRGVVPDDHLGPWLVARDAMADAPLDDVEWIHTPTTEAWVRGVEAVLLARGVERYSSLALAGDGSAAGMTFIDLHPDRPQLAHQEDTAVVPGHRGHGLGRWLKAANLRQMRAARPEVEIVETYNAETNGPMLDINVAMGFRPSRTEFAYQAPADEVAAHLGVT